MIRILLDMNLSPRWVTRFQEVGYEAVHWMTIGKHDAPDEQLFRYAREHAYVIFTHDLDFGTLLAQCNSSGPSVIQLRAQNVDPDELYATVLAALSRFEKDLIAGALVTIDSNRMKARLLPLNR